jgi:hypothetical protein
MLKQNFCTRDEPTGIKAEVRLQKTKLQTDVDMEVITCLCFCLGKVSRGKVEIGLCVGWRSLSLVSTVEELLGRNSRNSGLENRKYGRRDLLL